MAYQHQRPGPSASRLGQGTGGRESSGTVSPITGNPKWHECVVCLGWGLPHPVPRPDDKPYHILPCLHFACSIDCLNKLKRNSNPPSCPICRLAVSEADLMQLQVLRPSEILKGTGSERNAPCPPCQSCVKQPPSVAYCSECNWFLCKPCFNFHPNLMPYAGHTPDALTLPFDPSDPKYKASKGKGTNPDESDEMCAKHPEHELLVFCETCDEQICDSCLMDSVHQRHTMCTLNEAASKIREELKHTSADIVDIIRGCKKLDSRIDAKMRDVLDVQKLKAENELAAQFAIVLSELSRREMEVRKEIVMLCSGVNKKLSQRRTQVNSTSLQAHQFLAMSKNIRDKASDRIVLATRKILKKGYSKLKDEGQIYLDKSRSAAFIQESHTIAIDKTNCNNAQREVQQLVQMRYMMPRKGFRSFPQARPVAVAEPKTDESRYRFIRPAIADSIRSVDPVRNTVLPPFTLPFAPANLSNGPSIEAATETVPSPVPFPPRRAVAVKRTSGVSRPPFIGLQQRFPPQNLKIVPAPRPPPPKVIYMSPSQSHPQSVIQEVQNETESVGGKTSRLRWKLTDDGNLAVERIHSPSLGEVKSEEETSSNEMETEESTEANIDSVSIETHEKSAVPDDLVTPAQNVESDTGTQDKSVVPDVVTEEQRVKPDVVTEEQRVKPDVVIPVESVKPETVTQDKKAGPAAVTQFKSQEPETVEDKSKVPESITRDKKAVPAPAAVTQFKSKEPETVEDKSKVPESITRDKKAVPVPAELTQFKSKEPETVTEDKNKVPETITRDNKAVPAALTQLKSKEPKTVTEDEGKVPDAATQDQSQVPETVTGDSKTVPAAVTQFKSKDPETVTQDKIRNEVSDAVTQDKIRSEVSDAVTQEKKVVPKTVTRGKTQVKNVVPDAVTQDKNVKPETVTQDKSKVLDAVTLSKSEVSKTITRGKVQVKSVVPDAVTQGKSVVPAAVTQGKSVVPDAVTQGKSVVPDAVTQGKSVVPDAVTQGKSVVPDAVTQGKSVVSDAVTQGKSVVPDAVTQGKSVIPDTVTQGKNVKPETVTQAKSKVPDAVTHKSDIPKTITRRKTQFKSLVPDEVTQVKSQLPDAVTPVKSGVLTQVKVKSLVSDAVTQIKSGALTQVKNRVSDATTPVKSGVLTQVKVKSILPDAVTPVKSGALTQVKNRVPDAITQVKSRVTDAVTQTKSQVLTHVTSQGPDAVTQVKNRVPDVVTQVKSQVPETVTQVKSQVPEAVTQVKSRVPDTVTKVKCQVPEAVTQVKSRVPDTVTQVKSQVPEAVTQVKSRVPDTVTKVKCQVPEAVTQVKSRVPDTVTQVKSRVPEAVTQVKSRVLDAVTQVKSGVPETVTQVKSGVPETVTQVKSRVSDAVTVTEFKRKKSESIPQDKSVLPDAVTQVKNVVPYAVTRGGNSLKEKVIRHCKSEDSNVQTVTTNKTLAYQSDDDEKFELLLRDMEELAAKTEGNEVLNQEYTKVKEEQEVSKEEAVAENKTIENNKKDQDDNREVSDTNKDPEQILPELDEDRPPILLPAIPVTTKQSRRNRKADMSYQLRNEDGQIIFVTEEEEKKRATAESIAKLKISIAQQPFRRGEKRLRLSEEKEKGKEREEEDKKRATAESIAKLKISLAQQPFRRGEKRLRLSEEKEKESSSASPDAAPADVVSQSPPLKRKRIKKLLNPEFIDPEETRIKHLRRKSPPVKPSTSRASLDKDKEDDAFNSEDSLTGGRRSKRRSYGRSKTPKKSWQRRNSASKNSQPPSTADSTKLDYSRMRFPLGRDEKMKVTNIDENEDYCAVCLDGGEDIMICCDICPKVFHLRCHIPAVYDVPPDDWQCNWCKSKEEGCNIDENDIENCDGVIRLKNSTTIFGSTGINIRPTEFMKACKFLCEIYKIECSNFFVSYMELTYFSKQKKIDPNVILSSIRKRLTVSIPESFQDAADLIKSLVHMVDEALRVYSNSPEDFVYVHVFGKRFEKVVDEYYPEYKYLMADLSPRLLEF